MTEETSNKTKTWMLAAVTTAALGAVVASIIYSNWGKKQDQIDEEKEEIPKSKKLEKGFLLKGEKNEKIEKEKKKNKEPIIPPSINDKKASELKDLGNTAYKEGKFLEAVQHYTDALTYTDSDIHLIYSNRSAANLAARNFKEAISDAERCVELVPNWSKGYYRLGRAYDAMKDYNNAYIYFYKGCLIDTKGEIRKSLDDVRTRLSFGELDSRACVESCQIQKYVENTCESLCKEIGIDYKQIKAKIQQSIDENNTQNLLELPEIAPLKDLHLLEVLRVIGLTLTSLHMHEAAIKYAQIAYEKYPTDPDILLLMAEILLKSPEGAIESFNFTRKAIQKAPENPFAGNMYAELATRLIEAIGTPNFPVPISDLLREIQLALNNPKVNKIFVAHAGMSIWFRYFVDPSISTEIYHEEQLHFQNGLTINEAFQKGLTEGVFSRLYLEPFFLQALSENVFIIPPLERILSPFRGALLTLPSNLYSKLEILILALSLHLFRNNYAWSVTEEEEKQVEDAQEKVEELLRQNNSIEKGKLSEELRQGLSKLALYIPLSSVQDIQSLIPKVDLSKLPPMYQTLLRKTVLDPFEEQRIKGEIDALTEIPDQETQFFNDHIYVWDQLQETLLPLKPTQELEWVFPKLKLPDFGEKVSILVAGCGTGQETLQIATLTGVEVTGIDISVERLAFAIRQAKELGINNARFYLGDIRKLNSELLPQFDIIQIHSLLNHLPNPMEGWANLCKLLRPGGIMKITIFSKKHIESIGKIRKILSEKLPNPVFEKNSKDILPKLLRTPTKDEARLARSILLNEIENNPRSEILEIVTLPSFYVLHQFIDLIFHPQMLGMTFKTIGECLQTLGLTLVGFEFPGVLQESILQYKLSHPDDPELKNCQYLDDFEEKDSSHFKTFLSGIQFVCQKPEN